MYRWNIYLLENKCFEIQYTVKYIPCGAIVCSVIQANNTCGICSGKTQFRIVGPVCTCSECQQDDFVTFPVRSHHHSHSFTKSDNGCSEISYTTMNIIARKDSSACGELTRMICKEAPDQYERNICVCFRCNNEDPLNVSTNLMVCISNDVCSHFLSNRKLCHVFCFLGYIGGNRPTSRTNMQTVSTASRFCVSHNV